MKRLALLLLFSGAAQAQFSNCASGGSCLDFSAIPYTSITGLGTFATQNYAAPPAIGGGTPNTGTFSSLTDSGVTGLTQCLHASSSGLITGTGGDCGGSVSPSTTGYVAVYSSSSTIGGDSLTTFQAAIIAANAQLVADSPSAGPINDYSPTGYGTTTAILYVTPSSGGTTLDGLVAGSAMQQVFIINAEAAGGADLIKLVNQSSSDSTAANRFLTSATTSLGIPPGGGVGCIYLASTVNRWWCH